MRTNRLLQFQGSLIVNFNLSRLFVLWLWYKLQPGQQAGLNSKLAPSLVEQTICFYLIEQTKTLEGVTVGPPKALPKLCTTVYTANSLRSLSVLCMLLCPSNPKLKTGAMSISVGL